MDFAWVVDALRRGLKVTHKAWAGDPPMYLYTSKTKNGKRTVMFCDGSKVDREACFRPDAVLDATDWEEYVEPKREKHVHQGDTPYFDSVCKGCFNCLWRKKGQTNCGGHPNLVRNAAGIVTECSSWIRRPDMTDDVLHGGQAVEDQSEYVEPKVRQEGPFVINPLPLTGTMGMHGGKPVEETDLDAEANKAIALVARNIAENLVELLRNPSVLRLLQKTDIPLSREGTNHV